MHKPETGVADGRGLIAWACKYADITDVTSQTKIRTALAKMALAPGSTQVQISTHAVKMLELWRLLQSASVDEPYEYYEMLLSTMPTEPQASLLTQLRTWFAGRMQAFKAAQAPDMAHPDDAVIAHTSMHLMAGTHRNAL